MAMLLDTAEPEISAKSLEELNADIVDKAGARWDSLTRAAWRRMTTHLNMGGAAAMKEGVYGFQSSDFDMDGVLIDSEYVPDRNPSGTAKTALGREDLYRPLEWTAPGTGTDAQGGKRAP